MLSKHCNPLSNRYPWPSRGWLYQWGIPAAYTSTVERIKGQIENIPALATTTDGWKALGRHHVWVLTVRLAPGFGRVLLNGFQ